MAGDDKQGIGKKVAAKPKAEVKVKAEGGSTGKLAVVRIRSAIHAEDKVKETLVLLRLGRKNICVVFDDTPSFRGMLRRVKDFVAFGEVSPDTVSLLQEKRGRKDKDGKVSNVFMLHPPRGGFERKGIKVPFALGGALGYRGAKIDDLLKKMV